MIERLNDFVSRFQTCITLDQNLLLKNRGRLFLVDENLKRLVSEDFHYAGTYLGRDENRGFLPSFSLLSMMAENKTNKVVVDAKTEWLFICGRDIFERGVVRVIGSKRKGDYTLIMNKQGECLGFGEILIDLTQKRAGVIIRNILDLGDFLRREV
jgi:ribosome biogenesis protein Nip4